MSDLLVVLMTAVISFLAPFSYLAKQEQNSYNMKKLQPLFIALVLLFVAVQSMGQDRIPVELKATQFTINLLEPSVMFENKLTDKTSVVVSAGLTTLGFYDSNLNNNPKITLNPFLRASFRNYYMRKKQKKELNFNSGDYVGLLGGYNFRSIAENNEPGTPNTEEAFFLGGVWGIQRNYQSGIHFGFSLGGGFVTGKNENLGFTGLGSLEFGFIIK